MSLNLPKKVTVGECVVREGAQHEEHFIPTKAKLWLLDRLIKAGFKKVEVTNFSSPKYLPQFADAEEVLKGIQPLKQGVTYSTVAVTQSAVDRAVKTCEEGFGPTEITNMWSTSESYSTRNTGMTHTKLFEVTPGWIKKAHEAGMQFCGCVGTVFGCSIEGPVPIERALEFAKRLLDMGADSIMFGDTTGEATPDRVYDFYCEVKDQLPAATVNAHFHESRGWGLSNCLAALQAGADFFDASMGGIGGQPATILDRVPVPGIGKLITPSDITGNVRSEDLIVMLDEMNIELGLDVDMVLDIGRAVEKIFGRRLRSYTVETGRIPKGPRKV
ncbi:MAG: pyruvate carboxyltransferase [Pseudomonadota bacterium]